MVNYANQANLSGIDEVVANSRVRATTASPNAQGVLWMQGTGVPFSGTGAAGTTITAAQFGGGLFVWNSTAAAQTVTLDTATNMVNYMNANSSGIQVGDIITCLVANGGGTNSFSLAAGSGGALDANVAASIPVSTSRSVNIRITNITTPAYVVYS